MWDIFLVKQTHAGLTEWKSLIKPMNKKKTAGKTATTGLDIRYFVRRYVDDIPSKDFNALINQIAFLDQFKSIQLNKGSLHLLNDVINKAIAHFRPQVLYSKSFTFEDRHFVLELLDFGTQCIYRGQLTFPDMEMKVNIKCFTDREDAEDFLVEKLSNQLLLQKL
jgi:hypothetical protein